MDYSSSHLSNATDDVSTQRLLHTESGPNNPSFDSVRIGDGTCEEPRSRNDEAEPRAVRDPFRDSFRSRPRINRMVRSFSVMLVIDIGLPLGLYYGLKQVLPVVYALVISGAPPLLYVIYRFIRYRQVHVLGVLIIISFIASAIVSIITGDARAALLRDSAITALISLIFFITLIPIRTRWFDNLPLTYLIGVQIMFEESSPVGWTDRHGVYHEMPVIEWMWKNVPTVRKIHYTLTAGWAIGLMTEFVIRVIMVEATSLTVDQIYTYGTIIAIVIVVFLMICAIIAGRFTSKAIIKWRAENDYSIRPENEQGNHLNKTDNI